MVGPAATAGAATAGLFGTAGAFSLGTTLATLGTALGGIGSISSVMGGISGQDESKTQANYALASAEMQGKEQGRQAVERATQEKAGYKDVMRRQKLAYMKSGVTLEGSPLLMMEETRLKGEANVDEILAAGGSGVASALTEGTMKDKQYKAQGRDALMSGITGGLGGASKVLGSFV